MRTKMSKNGSVIVRTHFDALVGVLPRYRGPTRTLEEMDEAVARTARERVPPVRRI